MLTESQEQANLILWLRRRGLLHCAVPNGGRRNRGEAAKMRREGVVAGAPDVFVFSEGRVAGIEMKRADGGCGASEAQLTFGQRLEQNGCLFAVCNGADAAIRQLEQWGF